MSRSESSLHVLAITIIMATPQCRTSMPEVTADDEAALVRSCIGAKSNAHSPYSKFPVGSAVLVDHKEGGKKIYEGRCMHGYRYSLLLVTVGSDFGLPCMPESILLCSLRASSFIKPINREVRKKRHYPILARLSKQLVNYQKQLLAVWVAVHTLKSHARRFYMYHGLLTKIN